MDIIFNILKIKHNKVLAQKSIKIVSHFTINN